MMFGGDKVPHAYQGLPGAANYTMTINGMSDPAALLVSLFRITLVDDYDYDVSSNFQIKIHRNNAHLKLSGKVVFTSNYCFR